uniref:Leucine-rich repeat-containing N-terminal plant-type domain-containing protein n=1 Tax=Setaria italica TaxID=4555 RepID=K3YZV2_SETIT
MNLGGNNFTGVIPKEIGHLKALLSLNLSSNKLTGVIPHSICKLINIQVLDLSGSHLTDGIPSELNNLHYLSAFNVSNNDLEGPIPIIGQLSTFTSSSFVGNPRLCCSMLAHQCGSTEEIFTTKSGRRSSAVTSIFAGDGWRMGCRRGPIPFHGGAGGRRLGGRRRRMGPRGLKR